MIARYTAMGRCRLSSFSAVESQAPRGDELTSLCGASSALTVAWWASKHNHDADDDHDDDGEDGVEDDDNDGDFDGDDDAADDNADNEDDG